MNPAPSPICRRVELMSAERSNYVAYAFEKKASCHATDYSEVLNVSITCSMEI